jgi:hypothetical protein
MGNHTASDWLTPTTPNIQHFRIGGKQTDEAVNPTLVIPSRRTAISVHAARG